MAEFRLEVVTPNRKVVEREVSLALLPSELGEIGILAHHAPLISSLTIGVMEFVPTHGERRRVALGDGFAEMADNTLTVLVDTAELDSEIDIMRAQEAKERAEKRLRDQQEEWDFSRAQVSLHKAAARIRAAEGSE